jgi:carbamoylphosphate synthase large subunit
LPFTETIAFPGEIEGFLARSSFPYIAKPRRGYASKGVKVLFSPEEVRQALSDDGDTVVQEYLVRAGWEQNRQRYDRENIYEDGSLVRGEELTIMAFLGDDGDVMGLCPLVADGIKGTFFEVLDKPQIEEKARRIFEVLGSAGVRGPCNIQGIETASDEAWFFEINARLTGACAHCEAMGFDLFEAIWQHFIEGRDARKFLNVDRGLAFVRTWGTTVVRKDSVAKLRDEKFWRRDPD